MKSEVIEKILSVESQAEEIVRKADDEARKLVSDAQSESARIVSDALDEERRRGDEVVREATAVLDVRLSEIEKKTEQVQNTEAEIDPDAAADAARKIVSLVCSAGVFDVR